MRITGVPGTTGVGMNTRPSPTNRLPAMSRHHLGARILGMEKEYGCEQQIDPNKHRPLKPVGLSIQ